MKKLELGQVYNCNNVKYICLGYDVYCIDVEIKTFKDELQKAYSYWKLNFEEQVLKTDKELEEEYNLYFLSTLRFIRYKDKEFSYHQLEDRNGILTLDDLDIDQLHKCKEKVDIQLWLSKSRLLYRETPIYYDRKSLLAYTKPKFRELLKLKTQVSYEFMYNTYFSKTPNFHDGTLYYNTKTHWYYFYSKKDNSLLPLYYVKKVDYYEILRGRIKSSELLVWNRELYTLKAQNRQDLWIRVDARNYHDILQCIDFNFDRGYEDEKVKL